MPSGRPFRGLLALINSLDARVTALEDSGGNGGGGGLIENLGSANFSEIVYSASDIETTLDESFTQIPIPRDGQLVSLAVNPFFNLLDGEAVITVRVNGQDTALQINVPGGDSSVLTANAVVPVAAGDVVSLQTDTTGVQNGFIIFRASYELELE